MPFLIHSGSATNNSQTKSKHTCVHTHTPVYSQSCDLDELAQQLHSLRQWLALQDLSSDPVLHLAAPLQYQLEVEGAPSRLLSMEHITHKLHLFKHRNPVGTCSDFFLISALKGEADVENWNVCVCVCCMCALSDLVHTAEELPVKHHQLVGHFLCTHVMEFAVTRGPVDLLRQGQLMYTHKHTHL